MAKAVIPFSRHRWSGEPLRWLKTANEFPSPELLAVARRKLGEYLLEQRSLSAAELEEALVLHRATGARLGDADQITPQILRRFPEPLAEELDVLPLEQNGEVLIVAVAEPLSIGDRYRLEQVVSLLDRAHIVLTDSGGVQEEAPTFGKPLLVLREVTERPEGIAAGVARLVGTGEERIVAETTALLRDPLRYAAMATGINPYGDGNAAKRIAAILGKVVRRRELAQTA